jgi:hypothetical protein
MTASVGRRPSSAARSVTAQSVAALLSASLLGIGLAYCACAFLIPAVAREGAGIAVPAADGNSQDVICSGAAAQALRAGE